jgi:hypothetical protein
MDETTADIFTTITLGVNSLASASGDAQFLRYLRLLGAAERGDHRQ